MHWGWPDLFCFLFGLVTVEGNSVWLDRPLPAPFRSLQLSESLPFPMPSRLLDRDKDRGDPWEKSKEHARDHKPGCATASMLNTAWACYLGPHRWCSCWACTRHDWPSAALWWSRLAWTSRSPDHSMCWSGSAPQSPQASLAWLHVNMT